MASPLDRNDPRLAERLSAAGGVILRPPPPQQAEQPETPIPPPEDVEARTWVGVVAVEGAWTVDSKLLEPHSLTWATPVPLMQQSGDLVGKVDQIRRQLGGLIVATGTIGLAGFKAGTPWSHGVALRVGSATVTRATGPDGYGQVLTAGRIEGLILVDGLPSWPAARITVTGGHIEDVPITREEDADVAPPAAD
jgi:hypothetical protein